MEKENLDFFLELYINCESQLQAEDLMNILEDNISLVTDWDIQSVDVDGSQIEGGIINIQFSTMADLIAFYGLLHLNGYEL